MRAEDLFREEAPCFPRDDRRRERADMRFQQAGIFEEEKASGVAAKAQRGTRALLDSGREQGYLTAAEIAGALDELDLEPAQIDDFYHALDELRIEVVTGDDEDEDEDRAEEAPRQVSTDSLQ